MTADEMPEHKWYKKGRILFYRVTPYLGAVWDDGRYAVWKRDKGQQSMEGNGRSFDGTSRAKSEVEEIIRRVTVK